MLDSTIHLFKWPQWGVLWGGKIFAPNSFPFYFKFSGGIYHSLPPVIPMSGQKPKFVQIYILDTKMDQLNARIQNDARNILDKTFLNKLNELIVDVNPYARKFKKITNEYINQQHHKEVAVKIMHSSGQYSAPTENEIAAFIPNSTGQYNESISTYRHIQLRDMNDKNFSINEMNPMYDPLHCPLMFPYRDLGYEYIPCNQYQTKNP